LEIIAIINIIQLFNFFFILKQIGERKKMFEQIEIPEMKSPSKCVCNCKNTEWIEDTIEVKPIIAGGLIIAWEIEMGIANDPEGKLAIRQKIETLIDKQMGVPE